MDLPFAAILTCVPFSAGGLGVFCKPLLCADRILVLEGGIGFVTTLTLAYEGAADHVTWLARQPEGSEHAQNLYGRIWSCFYMTKHHTVGLQLQRFSR